MRRWSGLIWLTGSVALVLVLRPVLRFDPAERNLEAMPEMVYAPSYKAYEANPNFGNGTTLRTPPAGAIPRGHLPLVSGQPLTLETAAGLANPLEASDQTLAQGAALFGNFCQVCHGPAGQGDGPVTRRGVPPPPPFTEQSLAKLTAGQIFQIITEGKGNMPSHKSQIRAAERWKVVLHVQTLGRGP